MLGVYLIELFIIIKKKKKIRFVVSVIYILCGDIFPSIIFMIFGIEVSNQSLWFTHLIVMMNHRDWFTHLIMMMNHRNWFET